jgi:hypothetical protein
VWCRTNSHQFSLNPVHKLARFGQRSPSKSRSVNLVPTRVHRSRHPISRRFSVSCAAPALPTSHSTRRQTLVPARQWPTSWTPTPRRRAHAALRLRLRRPTARRTVRRPSLLLPPADLRQAASEVAHRHRLRSRRRRRHLRSDRLGPIGTATTTTVAVRVVAAPARRRTEAAAGTHRPRGPPRRRSSGHGGTTGMTVAGAGAHRGTATTTGGEGSGFSRPRLCGKCFSFPFNMHTSVVWLCRRGYDYGRGGGRGGYDDDRYQGRYPNRAQGEDFPLRRS